MTNDKPYILATNHSMRLHYVMELNFVRDDTTQRIVGYTLSLTTKPSEAVRLSFREAEIAIDLNRRDSGYYGIWEGMLMPIKTTN